MKQSIIGGVNNLLNNSTTEYHPLSGGYGWDADELRSSQIVSTSGTFSNLWVELDGIAGSGRTWIFTLMKNGAATALTCSITGIVAKSKIGTDITNSVTYAAGDTISLRATSTSSPPNRAARWACRFTGDAAKESLLLTAQTTAPVTPGYTGISGCGSGVSVEASNTQIIPTAGTLKNLYVKFAIGPQTDKGNRFTIRKNGVDTDITFDINEPGTSGSDTTNEVTVVAGDRISLQILPLNSPSQGGVFSTGMTFVADTDGESIVMGGGQQPISGEYHSLSHTATSYSATESDHYQLTLAGVLKSLYVYFATAPGATKSYDVTVQINGATTALTVNVADSATTGNNTSDTVAVFNGDEVAVRIEKTNNPDTTLGIRWSVISIHGVVLPSRRLTRITGMLHTFYPKHTDPRLRYSLTCILGGISEFFPPGPPYQRPGPGVPRPGTPRLPIRIRPPFIWPGLPIGWPGAEEPRFPSRRVPEEPLPGEEPPEIPGRPGPERPIPGGPIPDRPTPGGPKIPPLPDIPLP